MTTTHEEISKRAREIWEREGRPEGRDKEHWLQAETELRQETMRSQASHKLEAEDSAVLNVPAGVRGSSSANSNSNSTNKEEAGRRRSSMRRAK